MFNMPWNDTVAEERRFRLIVAAALIVALVISIVVPLIELPEIEREEAERLPPRLAKLILERKKVEPPKVELPKVEEKKPEPEPEPEPEPKKEEPKPEPKPEPEPPKPQPKPEKKEPPKKVDIEAARKKAASVGVLAMKDMLADLREAAPVESITAKKPLIKEGAAKSAPRADSNSLLLSGAAKGSGGIDTSSFSRQTGGAELAGRETVQVSSAIEALEPTEPSGGGKKASGPMSRSEDEISRVMNAHKSAIYNIYQRALRKNPLLRGTVVFRITIAPDGSVTRCEIVSSDLGDKRLERKLVLRIKRIDFGAKDVEEVTVNYPIEFLPP